MNKNNINWIPIARFRDGTDQNLSGGDKIFIKFKLNPEVMEGIFSAADDETYWISNDIRDFNGTPYPINDIEYIGKPKSGGSKKRRHKRKSRTSRKTRGIRRRKGRRTRK